MPLVRRNVSELMVAGAKAELETLQRARRARKQIDDVDPFSSDYMEAFGLEAHDLGQRFGRVCPHRFGRRFGTPSMTLCVNPIGEVLLST